MTDGEPTPHRAFCRTRPDILCESGAKRPALWKFWLRPSCPRACIGGIRIGSSNPAVWNGRRRGVPLWDSPSYHRYFFEECVRTVESICRIPREGSLMPPLFWTAKLCNQKVISHLQRTLSLIDSSTMNSTHVNIAQAGWNDGASPTIAQNLTVSNS